MKLTGPQGIQIAAAAIAGFLLLVIVYDVGRASVSPPREARKADKDWFNSLPDADPADSNGLTPPDSSEPLPWDSPIPEDPRQRTPAQEELYQARVDYNLQVRLHQGKPYIPFNKTWNPSRRALRAYRERNFPSEEPGQVLKRIQDEARQEQEEIRRQQEESHRVEVEYRLRSIDDQLRSDALRRSLR